MGFSNMMIAAAKSIPKSTITQSMPSFTFFLLHHKHVVVKELLKLLVDEINGYLLKSIILEDFKPSNVQHSTEVCFLESCINKSVITLLNQPFEDTVKDSTSNTSSSTSGLLNILTLGHPLCADFNSWFAESLHHGSSINTKRSCGFTNKSVRATFRQLCLLIATLLDILNTSTCHDTSSKDIAIKFLPCLKSKDIESIFCIFKLLVVVDGRHGGFTL